MVGIVGLGYCQHLRPSLPHPFTITNSNSNIDKKSSMRVRIRRRKTILIGAGVSLLSLLINSSSSSFARELDEQEESTVVRLFQETSPCVVFIQVLEKPKNPKDTFVADATTKVEGTGSGFLWDNFGHIVTNYHVVANLATDQSGLRFCKVTVVDAQGNKISTEAQIIGFDQTYDLAVLKFDSQGKEFSPALIGTSRGLRVGQNCFAIGNPYGYENTLTTGVVSGLGREIPSPNGQAIRGAIQTDASINAGNSGGPLIDSYGHVIGVNTATFTRKGTGMSSGVNFAIPIDTVLRTVPSLIVYGTPYSNRY